MFKQLRNNESGIILVTVLIIIFVLMLLAVSKLAIDVSEVQQLEDIGAKTVAQELALLYYWRIYYNANYPLNHVDYITGRQYNTYITLSGTPPMTNVVVNVVY
ncbi:MAG: hypothetical protein A2Z88_08655 [Omnitrophica WOR_2 bacterium GWA2_47_8]|nr:MAG: hypothetical protein A2Z88_08655 [Omnitrophica WOR_2 bacterium GWA2_47_8]